jgi:molecular chaperone HtpG
LLHGVIDSPDIPLNVSRSSLQSDANVKKITSHISKKVADKLAELFKADREDFQKKWGSIDLFVKYGMLSDEKFAEKGKDFCLLEDTKGNYKTITEYIDQIKTNQVDSEGNTVLLYTNNAEEQHSYIHGAESRGYSVIKLEGPLDNHFTGFLEQKNEKVQCKRVDAEALDKLIKTETTSVSVLNEDESKKLMGIFESANQQSDLKFATEALSPSDDLLTITESEQDRRMREMSKMNGFNMFGNLPMNYQTILNTNHPKAKLLIEMKEEEAKQTAQKALSLAMLSKGLLKGEKLTNYVRSEFEKL